MNNKEAEGSKVFNIDHVENMRVENTHLHTHVHTNSADKNQPSSIDYISEWQSLNAESFCLFVLIGETYSGKSFSIAKSCALRYTPLDYQKRYNVIFPSAVEEVMHMPCIFAQRNTDFKWASNLYVKIGKIREIVRQGMNLRFSIEKYGYFQQQIINQNIDSFGLLYNDLRNQLDEEHWSICRGNLPQILDKLNIAINWRND